MLYKKVTKEPLYTQEEDFLPRPSNEGLVAANSDTWLACYTKTSQRSLRPSGKRISPLDLQRKVWWLRIRLCGERAIQKGHKGAFVHPGRRYLPETLKERSGGCEFGYVIDMVYQKVAKEPSSTWDKDFNSHSFLPSLQL